MGPVSVPWVGAAAGRAHPGQFSRRGGLRQGVRPAASPRRLGPWRKDLALLPREAAGSGTALSWGSAPLHLPNGDWLAVKQLRALPAAGLKLPDHPAGAARSFPGVTPCYRVADLPPECAAGWMVSRRPAGQTQWVDEQATADIPGEVRGLTEGVAVLPWFFEMFRPRTARSGRSTITIALPTASSRSSPP